MAGGSTYIMGDYTAVPAAKYAAKASFSTLAFGKYGGWVPESEQRVPVFASGQVQELGFRGLAGLGAVPAIPLVAGTAAAAVAIGGLLGLIKNAMDDDWADTQVFNSHARSIHSAMLAIQCIVGGAETNKPLIDTLGNKICPGGTPTACHLNAGQLSTWRALRDGFSKFWAETAKQLMGPTNAQALRLKGYAREFHAFYTSIVSTCRSQGVKLPAAPELPDSDKKSDAPAWLKWTVAGVGLVSLVFVVRLFIK